MNINNQMVQIPIDDYNELIKKSEMVSKIAFHLMKYFSVLREAGIDVEFDILKFTLSPSGIEVINLEDKKILKIKYD